MRRTAEERKAEILEAAKRLADKAGPDRLSTEAIARDFGQTQPGIFRHFPTKQLVREAVAGFIAGRMMSGWQAVYDNCDRPEFRLASVILGQLRLIRQTPAMPAILLPRELQSRNDVLRKAAMAARRFRSGVDAGDAAYLLIGMVQGLAVRWSLSGRRFDLADEGRRLPRLQMERFVLKPKLPAMTEARL